jgi:histidyl-tRNA synthetase
MPEDAAKLEKVLDIVRSTFGKYGFQPLYTPAFEDFGLLAVKGGLGETVKDDIYFFKDKSERELGLRFDLTMPMVRVVASNPQLKLPFKRYAIGRVWRYDRPQAMRYREFWQADVDIVGTKSVRADAECLACICESLERLGFQDYYIRVNSRKIMQSIFKKLVGERNVREAFRSIDKLDKIGVDGVEAELEKKGLLSTEVMKFLKIEGSNAVVMRKLKRYGDGEGTIELESLVKLAKNFGIAKRLRIDVSLVRGLDYYTGNVFEVFLGDKVSCGGGGRYDDLIEAVGGQAVPATGISLGISRIVEVMKQQGMFKPLLEKEFRVFVANVDDESLSSAFKVAAKLRRKGIACETDSMGRKLTKQLEYADATGARFAIIVGKKEMMSGKLKFKDMWAKKEEELTVSEIAKKLRKIK